MAPQLTVTKGLSFRSELKTMARAMSSFPVPDSPVISTELVVEATLSMSRKIAFILLDWVTMLWNWAWRSISRRSVTQVSESRICSVTLRTTSTAPTIVPSSFLKGPAKTSIQRTLPSGSWMSRSALLGLPSLMTSRMMQFSQGSRRPR